MNKILNWIFNPNWKIIHIEREELEYWLEPNLGLPLDMTLAKGKQKGKSICILEYSDTRNQYRIRFEGYIPPNKKESNIYLKCLEKQKELTK